MTEKIKYLLFFVVMVCILSGIGSLELDSFLLDAMDDTMLTMESERSAVDFTKEIEVSTPMEKPVVTTFGKTLSRRRMACLYFPVLLFNFHGSNVVQLYAPFSQKHQEILAHMLVWYY